MKLFIPAVGYRIKLVEDWRFTLFHEDRNKTMFEHLGIAFNQGNWNDKMKHEQVTVPSGTLLEVDRVYVRTMNKAASNPEDDYDSMTFKYIAEKQKKVRFWAKLVDVNCIEYELPEDFSAGKKHARENAKKPKKLTPDTISDILRDAARPYRSVDGNPKESWYTNKVKKLFDDIAEEYKKRRLPLDREDAATSKENQTAERRHQFQTGILSIPLSHVSLIKTFEDYDRCFPVREYVNNGYYYTADYVIYHKIVGGRYGNVSGKRTFARDKDGRCVRKWHGSPPGNSQSFSSRGEQVDCSDMWIEVVTDKEDLKILEVRGGFTPVQTAV